jgi:multimeric flavodoxin WrbA
MKKILIVYHSQSGHTLKMARAVAGGVESIEGVQVLLKKAQETGASDLVDCDGLVIASPEYFGYMAGAVKDFFDRTYETLRGHPRIFRKPYALCISAGNDGQGAHMSIERICLGFQFKKIQAPVIARGEITEEILASCEALGQTIAAGCEAGIF